MRGRAVDVHRPQIRDSGPIGQERDLVRQRGVRGAGGEGPRHRLRQPAAARAGDARCQHDLEGRVRRQRTRWREAQHTAVFGVGRLIAQLIDQVDRAGDGGREREHIVRQRVGIDRSVEEDRDRGGLGDPIGPVGRHQQREVEPGRERREAEADGRVEGDAGHVERVPADLHAIVGLRLQGLGRQDLEQLAAPANLVGERGPQAERRLHGRGVHQGGEAQLDRRLERDVCRSIGRLRLHDLGGTRRGKVEWRRRIGHPVAGKVLDAGGDRDGIRRGQRERLARRVDHDGAAPADRALHGRIDRERRDRARLLDGLGEGHLDARGRQPERWARPAGSGSAPPRPRSGGGRRRCWRDRGRQRGRWRRCRRRQVIAGRRRAWRCDPGAGQRCRRRAGRIWSSSRYFATVRRASAIPSAASASAIS